LYFDHHPSNKPPEGQKITGCWKQAPSATEVIYDYYKDEFDLKKYSGIVEFVSRFDSGNIVRSDAGNPDNFMNLAFAITRKDKDFALAVLKALVKMKSVEEFFNESFIVERIKLFIKYQKDFREYVKTHIEIIGNIAFVDNREIQSDVAHAFLVNVDYPDTEYTVMIKEDLKDPSKINLSLSHNNFNKNKGVKNLLPVVKEINPKISGGHTFACGVTLPEGMSMAEAKQIIVESLRKT
jgi:nanoRNase/pAp phosphatase (c-di-AMP/oligoRNAs hydrolase)